MPNTGYDASGDQRFVAKALNENAFTRRRYAWTSEQAHLFLKIPRVGNSVSEDALSSVARSIARREYEELCILADLSSTVVRPIAFVEEYACILMPRINGIELRALLIKNPRSERSQQAIREAIWILAKIHCSSLKNELDSLPIRAYISEKNYDPLPQREQIMTLVIEGFEIRNFLLEQQSNSVWFYDPHNIGIGRPEEDVMRFVLSLLMINWSRSFKCTIWKHFSYKELLNIYKEQSGFKLSEPMLRNFFKYNIKLRSGNSAAAIRAMPYILRPFASFYRVLYMRQIEKWALQNGL